MFHALVDEWFARRFGEPTSAQARAWPIVAEGGDVLVAAPTGSGKTLAAFLFCLDRLVREGLDEGRCDDRTDVVYVSPLRALSNDVQRNLSVPLAEIAALAAERGLALPKLRAFVRTGDTTAHDRRASAKRPPHVLVTTPESLYVLLGSASGRAGLGRVRTVIVDEIHAMAPDKRGAHLALTLERLDDLVIAAGGARPQRIGLSATVRPIEVAARLLAGSGRPAPTVVDVGLRRDLDLAIEVPRDELGAVCTHEQWDEVYDRVAELVTAHRSTLVFAPTRRLVERIAHHLASRVGADAVATHHGSLSRARRFEAEQRLKRGEVRAVVATASLELGIDVGTVDLVCLVGSSRSISTAVQRVGRSGHAVGATPRGRLFPLTRDQLVEHAALVRAARRGELDAIALRDAPLDVLAQQIVAICAAGERREDDLFELVRRAAPYEHLGRDAFDALIAMLAEGVATARRGRAGALLHRDLVGGVLRARRGAALVAIMNGGAIADTALYDVVLEPEGVKVGTLDEDFAVESMAGDVFVLGAASWRIRRVAGGKVHVEDARGAPPSIPFWLGEAAARTAELSAEVGALRAEVARRIDEGPGWIADACGLDERGAGLLFDYLATALRQLGAMPSGDTIVAERFFDEAGGTQLVLHAPFGGRINRAWGMALRKRFCRQFDFELQAAATDDGVLLSLGPQHSFPLEAVFSMLDGADVRELLVQAALQAPMFRTRFRWNASRALVLPRFSGGRRVPPPLMRMRADDLLAAVFPGQQACQDNHGFNGTVELPDHPLVFETVRDCLVEALDAEGFGALMARVADGRVRCVARETAEPSVLAHEILNANPYAFLDDAPLEERRARAVALRRGLPAAVVERLGGLDAEAIATVVAEATPAPRSADELHEWLVDAGLLAEAEGRGRGLAALFDELRAARRAFRLGSARGHWCATERRGLARALHPGARCEPEPPRLAGAAEPSRDEAVVELLRGHLAYAGPRTAQALATALDLSASDVAIALARIEGDGAVMRGRFSPSLAPGEEEWCDRRLLARIHRLTVERLRRAVEPVSAAALVRFFFAWQHARPGAQWHGREGLGRVIGQLAGFEAAAGAWEQELFPLRVAPYDPAWLDALCLSGEVVWGRMTPRASAAASPTRAAPLTWVRRRDLATFRAGGPDDDAGLSHPARDALAWLGARGASFFDEIVGGTGRLGCEVEDALGELVAAGRITADAPAGLRALLEPASRRSAGPRRRPRRGRGDVPPFVAAGRWSKLAPPGAPLAGEARVEALARAYLARWGVLMRELIAREPSAPPWRDLLVVCRRLELRGELRGGRFVGGFVGEQFALPEALDALRAVAREPLPADPPLVRVSACDPLNLVGVVTPGPRVAAQLGTWVAYRGGVPVDEGTRAVVAS